MPIEMDGDKYAWDIGQDEALSRLRAELAAEREASEGLLRFTKSTECGCDDDYVCERCKALAAYERARKG